MESSNVGEEIMAKKSNKYGVDAFRYMPYMIGGWAGGVPGTEMTYCRIGRVDKEYGGPQPVKI